MAIVTHAKLIEGALMRMEKDYRLDDTNFFAMTSNFHRLSRTATVDKVSVVFKDWIVACFLKGEKAQLTGLFTLSAEDDEVKFKVSKGFHSQINEKDLMGISVKIPKTLVTAFEASDFFCDMEEDQIKRAATCFIEQIVANLILHRDVMVDKLGTFEVSNEFNYHRDNKEEKKHTKDDQEVTLSFSPKIGLI